MSQVKWVHPTGLLNEKQVQFMSSKHVPVIPLSALTEVVEGLKSCKLALESCKSQIRGALPRMEVESAIDEAQRLLAQLDSLIPKQDAGSNGRQSASVYERAMEAYTKDLAARAKDTK